jgi:ABC-2 type transport system ATP-binding protein
MIEVIRLSKSYRTRTQRGSSLREALRSLFFPKMTTVAALSDIDWQVEAGSIHALIGRNGSGKSTLIKILCGILHPTSGLARVGGIVPWQHRRTHVQRIGVVFGQKSQLTWELPALDSFALHQSLYRVPAGVFTRTLGYLLEVCEAAAIVRRPVRSLSLGERMKCELICALLHQPEVLFLDEPTIGLDLMAKDQIRRAIGEINASLKTTIVLTSHDISDVASLCAEVSLLDRGRFLYQGSIRGLMEAHSERKTVRLELERPVDDCLAQLGGVVFTRTGEHGLSIELPRGGVPLQSALSRLVANLPVRDMSVEGLSLERVVRSIYEKAQADGGPPAEVAALLAVPASVH